METETMETKEMVRVAKVKTEARTVANRTDTINSSITVKLTMAANNRTVNMVDTISMAIAVAMVQITTMVSKINHNKVIHNKETIHRQIISNHSKDSNNRVNILRDQCKDTPNKA